MKGKIFLGVMLVVGLIAFVFAPSENLSLLLPLRVTSAIFIVISIISLSALRNSRPEIEPPTRSQHYRQVDLSQKLDHARSSRLGADRAREMGELSEPDSHYTEVYRHH